MSKLTLLGAGGPEAVNLLANSTNIDNADWVKSSATCSSNVITDADAGAIGVIFNECAANSGSVYRLEVFVLKDADTSRYPGIGFVATDTNNDFGTSANFEIAVLNTSAGTRSIWAGRVGDGVSLVSDAGSYWKVTITMTINSTYAQCRLYPAINSDGGTATSNTATGSATIQGAYIYKV